MNTPSHSEKGFKFAIITVVFFLLFLLLKVLAAKEYVSVETYTYIGGFLMIVVAVSSIIGFIHSMRGIKERRSKKKIIGILVNSVLMLLFLATTIANIIDFSNAMI